MSYCFGIEERERGIVLVKKFGAGAVCIPARDPLGCGALLSASSTRVVAERDAWVGFEVGKRSKVDPDDVLVIRAQHMVDAGEAEWPDVIVEEEG